MDWLIGTTNLSFFDFNTHLHFWSALVLGFLVYFLTSKNYWLFGFSLICLWELFEGLLRVIRISYPHLLSSLSFLPSSWFTTESVLNILSDLLIGFFSLSLVYFFHHNYR